MGIVLWRPPELIFRRRETMINPTANTRRNPMFLAPGTGKSANFALYTRADSSWGWFVEIVLWRPLELIFRRQETVINPTANTRRNPMFWLLGLENQQISPCLRERIHHGFWSVECSNGEILRSSSPVVSPTVEIPIFERNFLKA